MSPGGWTAGSRNFSPMAADPAKRKTFIDSVIELCLQFGFDGADLDWEYPAFFEGSSVSDRENFAVLVKEMGAALRWGSTIRAKNYITAVNLMAIRY